MKNQATVSKTDFCRIYLGAFSCGLTVAWLTEAFLSGRGPVSKYLAPFAIAGLLASSIMTIRKSRTKQD
jgi:hypothetical protein